MKIRDRIKELRRVKSSELIPNPKNWRTHPIAQQDALKGILAEVGFAGAVLARELDDGSLMLIDGHMRAETTSNQEIPVLVLDVTEAESDKLLATFDPIAALAESDAAALDSLLRNVDTGSEALQKMLADLAEDAGLYLDDKEVVEDEVPEPPVDPITKSGDLWLLGDHRLLCGDSTKAEDVARLMDGAKADMCFTSPPYNAGTFGWESDSKYDGDEDDRDDYGSFLDAFCMEAVSACAVAIVNIQQLSGNKTAFVEWMHRWRNHLVDVAIWDKGGAAPAMEPQVMNSAFEYLVFLSSQQKPSRKIPMSSWRGTMSNIYRGGKQTKNEYSAVHRATFPVHLPTWGMTVCDEARSVYEPFCGTGTTLIAAEQLGRKCYGMEISPQYCDVIVKRWETLTGKKASLENKNA